MHAVPENGQPDRNERSVIEPANVVAVLEVIQIPQEPVDDDITKDLRQFPLVLANDRVAGPSVDRQNDWDVSLYKSH